MDACNTNLLLAADSYKVRLPRSQGERAGG